MSDDKKACCEPLEHPNLEPSWICCQCNPKTLNSNVRTHCKWCDHQRCDDPKVVVVLGVRDPDEVPPMTIDKKELN